MEVIVLCKNVILPQRKGRIVAGRMNKAQNKYLVYMATNIFDDGNEVFTQTKHFERLPRTWLYKSDVSAGNGHINPSLSLSL